MARRLQIAFDAGLLRSEAGVGWLVAASSQPLTLLSLLRCQYFSVPLEPNLDAEAEELHLLLPAGLEVVGAVVIGGPVGDEGARRAAELAVGIRRLVGVEKGSSCNVVCAAPASGLGELVYKLYTPGATPGLEVLEIGGFFADGFWKSFRLLRCQLHLNLALYLPAACSVCEYEVQVGKAVGAIVSDLKSKKAVVVGESSGFGSVVMQPRREIRVPEPVDGGVVENRVDVLVSDLDSGLMVSLGSGVRLPPPVPCTVLLRRLSAEEKIEAALLQYLPFEDRVTVRLLPLKVDVLCVIKSDASLSEGVADFLLGALCGQLMAMQKMGGRNGMLNPKLAAYHFWPPGFMHPVTVAYDLSYGEVEAVQVEARKRLHQRLGLPVNQPLLRVANAVSFAVPSTSGGSQSGGVSRLKDVHGGLTTGPVPGRHESLLQGSYEYYHYMQDHVDDNGWGCAYRSLQTIVSWFRLQHYTSLGVPSHNEIQQILVDIGDKEPAFVGSKDWIGAIELSFVLDKLLGVSCKIMNVNSGAELPGKCRELGLHFRTQGTPVMIGGGVLAYTLLGIQYNEFTGESSFLILDPHYTGGEDLKSILAGGWCGWKKAVSDSGEEFFLRNKFYNLLLPQRPITV